MSPESQRVAIAEFCKLPPEVTWKLPSSFVEGNLLPDFLNDLNACHAMMQWAKNDGMNSDQWEEFGRQIVRIHPTVTLTTCVDDGGTDFMEIDHWDLATLLADTTASNLCEAFLKTLNLWKE